MSFSTIISIRLLDRPPEFWYEYGPRVRMRTALQHAHCPWPTLHHLDSLYVNINNDPPLIALPRFAEVSGAVARVFLSRLHVYVHEEHVSFIENLVAVRAKGIWKKRTIQEDLFKDNAIYTMPDWFSKGEWITPPSTE